ncbi:MAG: hypothetical protein IPN34_19110 [Planctomycetes bacterium]|nr:hypothetical protein [Planctomycetota bacterium]
MHPPDAPKRAIVARCPRCGSTAVGEDEARSMIEFTYMQCTACGHGELVDVYERDEDWLVEIELPEGAGAIPPFLAPRAASTPSASAPRVELDGCVACCGADAAAAWDALRSRRVATLVDESHFSVSLSRCACGQNFAQVFLERVDWVGGEDDQTWLVVALRDAEVEELRAAPKREVESRLHALAWGRRFLARFFPTQGEISVAWRESGFAIGPHD